jgi:hypothetical protein
VKSGVERQTDLIGHSISLGLQMDCNTRVGFVESTPEAGATRESSSCNRLLPHIFHSGFCAKIVLQLSILAIRLQASDFAFAAAANVCRDRNDPCVCARGLACKHRTIKTEVLNG